MIDITAVTQRGILAASQLAQLELQVETLKQEVARLDKFNWSSKDAQTQAALSQFSNYTQQAGNLASSAQSVATQFQTIYPGYQAPQDYNDQYQKIVGNTRNALQGVMQAMAYMNQNNDVQNENNQLNNIQGQIQNAQGETQALQGLGQLVVQLASQLQLLRQTMTAQATAQDAYYSAQMQKDASSQANFNQTIANGNTNIGPLNGNPIKGVNFSK